MLPTDDGNENQKEGLSRQEFAQLTGMSVSTVIRLQNDGKLPKVQLGGFRCRVVIPRRALDELLETPKIQSEGDIEGVREAPPIAAKKKPGPKPGWMKH